MAKVVNVFDVINDFVEQLDNGKGEIFSRKKNESELGIVSGIHDIDVYLETYLKTITSGDPVEEFLVYSRLDNTYIKNKIIVLDGEEGCVLYVEFIDSTETGRTSTTSIVRDGKILDLGAYAGSAMYYIQSNGDTLEYCPIMRTDLDLSTPEKKEPGQLSGMGEMERVEHENFNIYENEDWNIKYFKGENPEPTSAESVLYLKYFGGKQPNPHFHFMSEKGVRPYIDNWSKGENTNVEQDEGVDSNIDESEYYVNANAVSIENLQNYIIALFVANAKDKQNYTKEEEILMSCDFGLPFLSLIKEKKLNDFKPSFGELTTQNLLNKLSLFIPNKSALKQGSLTFKENSAASLGVLEIINGKTSFDMIIKSIPEYTDIEIILQKVQEDNLELKGEVALLLELSLVGLLDKLYKVIAVINFSKVSEQENCKKNIKRIMSTCMNDVAMPFYGDRENCIWDIYDKGVSANMSVNKL